MRDKKKINDRLIKDRIIRYIRTLFEQGGKDCDSEFSYIEVWFSDQNSKPMEIEDKINITLVIN